MAINPKIDFSEIKLAELTFKLNKNFEPPPKGGIDIHIIFGAKNSYSKDKKTLTTLLSAELFRGIENAPFYLKVRVKGTFKGEHKNLQRFSKAHASAHLWPFMREIIGNITMRANFPPLLLPPINIAELLSTKKKKSKI